MKLKALLLGLATALAISATASAAIRSYTCGNKFSRIKIETGVPVEYAVSSGPVSIEAEGSDEYLQDLKISVKNGELWIRMERKDGRSININQKTLIRVSVSGPMLENIEASSGARFKSRSAFGLGNKNFKVDTSSGSNVEIDGSVTCGNLSVSTSSGSKVEIERCSAAKSVKVDASSGSKAELECVTAMLDINASSGASVSAEGTAGTASINASSAAKIDATDIIAEKMTVDASSGSSVWHSTPKAVEKKSSGATIKYRGRK